MRQRFDFEEIRPLYDEELQEVMPMLVEEPAMKQFVKYLMPDMPYEEIKKDLLKMKSKNEFQEKVIAPSLFKLAETTTTSLDLGGTELLSHDESYTYISNHRDIILDAGYLNILLNRHGFETAEVAIGDNLLIYPWIKTLVRMNKSFIVKRDVPLRQMLEISRRLSYYIHFALKIKGQSVWIAQREGRSKDSSDKTQEGLIKMLALGGGKNLIKSILSMNIAPVSISYEYDPCDYLKAQEFQLKRDDPEYKKTKEDDLLNMQTGLTGFKGDVHLQITETINNELKEISPETDKTEAAAMIAKLIDKHIHANMRIYPGNYVAYDLFLKTDKYASKYTAKESEVFLTYIDKQIEKIQIPEKDIEYLKTRLFEMYANPLVNFENAHN